MGYVYVYDSTNTALRLTPSMQCSHDALGPLRMHALVFENIALACQTCHKHLKKKTMHFRSNDVANTKQQDYKSYEFKLHESFDHFMLLVMRNYIMRTQYERKTVCFSKVSAAVLGRRHQTCLALFILSA